jgi:hypothetical protein
MQMQQHYKPVVAGRDIFGIAAQGGKSDLKKKLPRVEVNRKS